MEIEEIRKILREHDERLKKVEGALFGNVVQDRPVTSKKLSIGEFVLQKNPQDDLQRTVLFAYFLEKYDGQESFNSEDIQSCFIKSKAKTPTNISDKINQCIKKGWVSEHPGKKSGKKAFYLTTTGATAVDKNFLEEAKVA
jgi:hypothetical protein